jgi:hypothetical protein
MPDGFPGRTEVAILLSHAATKSAPPSALFWMPGAPKTLLIDALLQTQHFPYSSCLKGTPIAILLDGRQSSVSTLAEAAIGTLPRRGKRS